MKLQKIAAGARAFSLHPFQKKPQSRTQSLCSFWQGREALDNADEKVRIMISVPVPYS